VRINKLDLNQLVVLDALLSTQSVSRAAIMVHLSQPAVSAALSKFRDYFGDALLIPHGRNLVLTPFAESLAEPVRDLLLQVQALTRRRPELDASKIEREITIVGSDYVQTVFLAPLFRRASNEAPGLRFDVRSISGYISDELDQGDVDIVVSLASGVSDRHPSEVLFEDKFSCLVWTGNTVVKDRLTLDQFQSLGHVAVVLGRGRVPTLDQIAIDEQGLRRKVEIQVPTFSMVPAYLENTHRVGIVQTRLAKIMVAQWAVRLIPCPMKISPVVTAVQWHRYQTLDPAVSWVREALKELALEFSGKRANSA
jgi:LysR family nod box-dependent transcriptional activator